MNDGATAPIHELGHAHLPGNPRPRTHFCYECDHDVAADHEHGSPNFDPVVVPLEDMARWESERTGRPVCPGLPSCRWLAGLYPHNGPFVTDHAGWHEAGSHATVYGRGDPTCSCGAETYVGDNDGAFPHLTEDATVIVCSATGQRIGYRGETVDPLVPGSQVERLTRVEVNLTRCDHDLIAVAANDSGMGVEEWMREAALLLAGREGPTLAAIRD